MCEPVTETTQFESNPSHPNRTPKPNPATLNQVSQGRQLKSITLIRHMKSMHAKKKEEVESITSTTPVKSAIHPSHDTTRIPMTSIQPHEANSSHPIKYQITSNSTKLIITAVKAVNPVKAISPVKSQQSRQSPKLITKARRKSAKSW